MNIGRAAERSGLPAKTIRYYEEIGLIAPSRAANGYRDYGTADVERLVFLQRARRFGFSIADCRHLLALQDDPHRASAGVKAIAKSRLAGLDAAIAELVALKDTLATMAAACPGDAGPDCPILADLAAKPRRPDRRARAG
ncbi:Cu(I)-responsive transcriptional regulator [Prosthecomicrobium pneumaticum]|uniref:Cu(I)-responsive transcriptional regulator n=1 Tax=Prosthecomicrobium pneumaticum TaxID=81895 RepID=A0A7W9FMB8_9HYPH|nr:Cu(I)-responsive transcriptional regulator [Prosthecomicrobium pneumaticum]MBB5753327.1 Cu(I)-responsive transcriptional regulator [Prosthecomicrobium pneumaticum]